jgi:hypothetical protein
MPNKTRQRGSCFEERALSGLVEQAISQLGPIKASNGAFEELLGRKG